MKKLNYLVTWQLSFVEMNIKHKQKKILAPEKINFREKAHKTILLNILVVCIHICRYLLCSCMKSIHHINGMCASIVFQQTFFFFFAS